MGTIAKWGTHKFQVSPKIIRGFTGLQVKGSSDTTAKKKQSKEYVKRKSGKATEITLTVTLSAFTGCSVRKEAMQFVKDAKGGKKNYFYVGKKKLVSYKLMLTDATVKNVELAPNGKWLSAQVSLTMKQASKGGSGKSKKKSGGNKAAKGSKKVSVRTSSATSSATSSWSKKTSKKKIKKLLPLSVNATFAKKQAVKNANSYVARLRKGAKTITRQTKDSILPKKPQSMGTIAYRLSPAALAGIPGGERK